MDQGKRILELCMTEAEFRRTANGLCDSVQSFIEEKNKLPGPTFLIVEGRNKENMRAGKKPFDFNIIQMSTEFYSLSKKEVMDFIKHIAQKSYELRSIPVAIFFMSFAQSVNEETGEKNDVMCLTGYAVDKQTQSALLKVFFHDDDTVTCDDRWERDGEVLEEHFLIEFFVQYALHGLEEYGIHLN